MITQSFPSIRKVFSYKHKPQQQKHHQVLTLPPPKGYSRTPNQSDTVRATKMGITPFEFVRRDDIVRKHVQELYKMNVHIGTTVYGKNKSDYEQYGALKVEKIVGSYYDFNIDDKWPTSDNPFIMTLKALDPDAKIKTCLSNLGWISTTNPCLC